MGKKGQVFILAAILIVVILFSLAAIRNKSEQEQIRGDFEALSENYKIEAFKLINSALKGGEDVHKEFREFSAMFAAYAKGKNPDYGLIYILNFGDNLQIVNFLDREIIIQDECDYSVTINGSFSKVPANLNFENFNIDTSIVWGEISPECYDLGIPTPDETIPGNYFCANITTTGSTDFQVIIDGIGYYHCAEKGVPEIMQVSKMKQGEQVKVSSSGKCIDQNYCDSFNPITYPDLAIRMSKCDDCSGGACFWWPISCPGFNGGLCLSSYAYPSRDPTVGQCAVTDCNKHCVVDRIFYKDDCGDPIGTSLEDCASDEVCRDNTFPGYTGGIDPYCCSLTQNTQKYCCGNDICLRSSCGTDEGLADDCESTEVCHDQADDLSEVKCCVKEDHLECFENNVYWYSDCQTTTGKYKRESLKQTCSANTICRDSGLPPEIREDAVCCIKDYKVNCYDDNRYYFDGCGIVGSLFEDCKGEGNTVCRNTSYKGYDGGDESECCKLNYKKKCYDNDVYWYSDCETREGKFKECEDKGCEAGQCKTVYKQFKCQKSYVIYKRVSGEYECNDQEEWNRYCRDVYGQEATGTLYDRDDKKCWVTCYYPEWTTECFESSPCDVMWPVLPNEQTCSS